MKILVFHQFAHHNQLVASLCSNLNKQNVEADSFNIATWEFTTETTRKLPMLLSVLKVVLFHYKLKFLVLKLFPFVLAPLVKNYQAIDIHFFGTIYFNIINFVKKEGIKVKIMIWGSDFYRAPTERRERQREYYRKSDMIQIATEKMKSDFLAYYHEFEEKISLAHFGIFQFDSIEKILQNNSVNSIKADLGLPTDKLILTCGYNGIKAQQHLLLLDAINTLSNLEKEKIFLLFPMTSGVDQSYQKEIENKLAEINCNYKILTTHLTVEEVCKLRISSDIVINIQISDAFSASIQEHIYAKNMVIVGDWLPYNKFDDYNIFYKKTSLKNLHTTLQEAIVNYSELKTICNQNTDKVSKMSSWSYVIKNWVNLYKKLTNEF